MASGLTAATVDSPQAAVLWLWQAHNKANARLSGDPTEDPRHPKVQFPGAELCPKCYAAPESADHKQVNYRMYYGYELHLTGCKLVLFYMYFTQCSYRKAQDYY